VKESVEQGSEKQTGCCGCIHHECKNVNRQWIFGLRKLVERKENSERIHGTIYERLLSQIKLNLYENKFQIKQ